MDNANIFDRLPTEIQLLILEWLPFKEAIHTSLVCRRFLVLVYRHRSYSKAEAARLYRFVIKNRQLNFITTLLVHNITLRPAANKNLLIRLACMLGYPALVKHLLESGTTYPGFDPATEGNWPLSLACKHGQADVVRLLLKDPRIDPTARADNVFRECLAKLDSKYGYSGVDLHGCTGIMQLLVADGRVDPSRHRNNALVYACNLGDATLVKLLLADPRVNPADLNNRALRNACTAGCRISNAVDIVKLLLATGRVDPSEPLLEDAESRKGINIQFAAIYKLLLAHPRRRQLAMGVIESIGDWYANKARGGADADDDEAPGSDDDAYDDSGYGTE